MMFPKQEYIRSPALLKACRQIECQHCGVADGTVVAAHSNLSQHGKGRSIKSSDVFVASLCFACHSELDQGKHMSYEERYQMWINAHIRTVKELVSRGLWPRNVPNPIVTQIVTPIVT